MDRDQAEQMITERLIGSERVLSGTQRLLLIRSNEKQHEIFVQAETLRKQGEQVMLDAVMAIREDIGVPIEIPIAFEERGNTIVVSWMPPEPVKKNSDPVLAPALTGPGLALVKDEPVVAEIAPTA